MTLFTTGFHPAFDALSAHVDLSDVDAARTRVGRHVARCAACRDAVAELRALGDAARAVELPGAPSGMWARIERATRATAAAPSAPRATPSPEEPLVWEGAPSLRPTTHVPSHMPRLLRRGSAFLVAAAGVFVALLLPSPFHRNLSGSPDLGTWRFSPANPAAGARVRVRLEPPATFGNVERLLLLGRFTRPVGEPQAPGFFWSALDDSLATLTRGRDGAYEGFMMMPQRVAAASVHVAPVGGPYFRRLWDPAASPHLIERPVALVVGGDARGRPSFDALVGALLADESRPTGVGFAYSVPDTLIKYFPSEPIGYATDTRVGGRRLLDDVIAWFRRGERQYVKFDARLTAQPSVTADRALAMTIFANRISEPGEVRRWVMRLVREHPDDPRTLQVFGRMLSNMLNRPGTTDSVLAALPVADTLYERNGRRDFGGEFASVAARLGDTVTSWRWTVRSWERPVAQHVFYRTGVDESMMRDATMRAAALPFLTAQLTESCALPAGRYPAQFTVEQWTSHCAGRRRDAYAGLSLLWRAEGNPRRALAYADSGLAVTGFGESCQYRLPHQRRGEALLALGDTAGAIPEFAASVRFGDGRAERSRDSLGRILRPRVDSAGWSVLVARTEAEQRRCFAAWQERSRPRKTPTAPPGSEPRSR